MGALGTGEGAGSTIIPLAELLPWNWQGQPVKLAA